MQPPKKKKNNPCSISCSRQAKSTEKYNQIWHLEVGTLRVITNVVHQWQNNQVEEPFGFNHVIQNKINLVS